MADKIKLVASDNRPYVVMTLMNPEDVPVNITDANVVVYFRAAGATELIATIPCTIRLAIGEAIKHNYHCA